MSKQTKDHAFMAVAEIIAGLGTCDRKQVGCVIVRDGRCITWGYNGAPPGLPHCEDNMHGWEDIAADWVYGDQGTGVLNTDNLRIQSRADELIEQYGCRNATHAEANALAFAARQGISTEGATCFVTVSPCETCARLLIAAGIVQVEWKEEYRDGAGIELLRQAGL